MAAKSAMLVVVFGGSTIAVAGAAIDAPPTSPSWVMDGDEAGQDIDRSEWSAAYAANWSKSMDESGRPVRYELCLRERDEECNDERWFSVARGRVTSGTLQMLPGYLVLSCVRARDVTGKYSDETCSDGFRVTAAESEVEDVIGRRAEAGLPADRATVERQLESGAYGESWFGLEPPVAEGEEPDFTSLEFQTWTIDNLDRVEALYQRGVRVDVPRGSRVLQVTSGARACSASGELRAALGARLVDNAPAPVAPPTYRTPADPPSGAPAPAPTTDFPRMSEREIRSLVKQFVLGSAQYRSIGIESISYVRRGVHLGCLHAMSEWLMRSDIRRYLASNGFRYVDVVVDGDKVRIASDDETEMPGVSTLFVVSEPVRGVSIAA